MAKKKVPVVVVDTNRYLEIPINSQDGQFQIVGMSVYQEILYKYVNGEGRLNTFRFDPYAKSGHEKSFKGEVDNNMGKAADFLPLAFAIWNKLFPEEYTNWKKNAIAYIDKLRNEIEHVSIYTDTHKPIHGLTVDEKGVSVAELTAIVKVAAVNCFSYNTHKLFEYSGMPECVVKFGLEIYDQKRIDQMRSIGIEVKSELGTFDQAMQYFAETKETFLKLIEKRKDHGQ